MKRLLLNIGILFFLLSCQEREYINDSTYCVYKNFVSPDTLPFDITNLLKQTSVSIKAFDNVVELNAFHYADSSNHTLVKVNDTLSAFLDKKYTEACFDRELDIVGLDPDANTFFNIYHVKHYYYCGSIALQKGVNSLVFLNSSKENDFDYNDLILFNITNNKLISLIKLSSFARDMRPQDILLRTFIVDDLLVSIESPSEECVETKRMTLKASNNKVSYIGVSEGVRKKMPFTYYLFRVRTTGYVALLPSFVNVNEINILGKECNYHSSRSSM